MLVTPRDGLVWGGLVLCRTHENSYLLYRVVRAARAGFEGCSADQASVVNSTFPVGGTICMVPADLKPAASFGRWYREHAS